VRLNLGSGLQPMDGWVNVDQCDLPGVDLVHDLDSREPLPYPDASVSEFRAQHVIEHLRDPLRMMGECYRVAEPDALFILTCPYGSSDDADANPTHCRRMFLGSWCFFGQPYYWREDYGYRGDWRIEQVILKVDAEAWSGRTDGVVMDAVNTRRNVVTEMEAHLRAQKPARARERSLQEPLRVEIARMRVG
jgi:SAM-dependent methyltransferase